MATGRSSRTARARTRRRVRGIIAAALGLAGAACGGSAGPSEVPVARETPEEAILRIGTIWENRFQDRGFRAAPDPIATFTLDVTSRLAFTRGSGSAKEIVTAEESFKTADGGTFRCTTRGESVVTIQWGRSGSDAAVQLQRPGMRLARTCDAPGFPQPVLELPAFGARFALRGDRLVPYEPKTEQREYIPAS